MADATSLELDGQALRDLLDRVTDRLAQFVDANAMQPALHPAATALGYEPLPEGGSSLDEVLELLFSRVIPCGYNTTGPGFLGYFGGGGIVQAAVADLIAGTVNRFTGRWAAAPGAVRIEQNVIRWFCDMAGYPAGAGGLLTSGGSISNLTALFSARVHKLAGADLARACFYASDQVHFSLRKAALVCGLPAAALREVPSDAQGCIDLRAARVLIAQDRRRGLLPFLAVANGGTFASGAVDDLAGLSAWARDEGLWLHLDAAYGGFFALTGRGRQLFEAMDQCDSITLDPHKSLFLPYGTGALLFRDAGQLKDAHAIDADFYGPMQDDPQQVDFCALSMEQTRQWRGLRVWLPLKVHGVGPFRANLEEKLALAAFAAEELRTIPGIEVMGAPMLSVVNFRLVLPAASPARLRALNEELLARIHRRHRVFLMGTLVRGSYALRICVLSFRTHLDRLRLGLADVREATLELLAEERAETH